MTTDVQEIQRVSVEVKAAASPERAQLLTHRIRGVIDDRLPGVLSAFRFRDVLSDDSFLFIDRLEVECQVGGHWSDDLVGRAFGEALLVGLQRKIESAGDVRFADRGEYVAAFIAALLDGGSCSRWWFTEFDGLKPLPLSAALRTVVINEGEAGISALKRLTEYTARRVYLNLTSADADRVLEHVIERRRGLPGTDCGLLCRFAEQAGFAISERASQRLARWISLERYAATRIAPGDFGKLLIIDKLIAAGRAGRLRRIMSQPGSATDLVSYCLDEIGEGENAALVFSVGDCAVLVERLGELSCKAQCDEQVEEPANLPGFSVNGGALLLLVRLLRLQWWDRWWNALQTHDNGSELAMQLCPTLALMVVAKALDPERANRIRSDDVIRRAFGVHSERAIDMLCREHRQLCLSLLTAICPGRGDVTSEFADAHASWEEVVAASVTELLKQFAAAIPGCAGSSHDYLRKQCLNMPASVIIEQHVVRVALGRPPLDVLLSIAGIRRMSAEFPDRRKLILDGEIFP